MVSWPGHLRSEPYQRPTTIISYPNIYRGSLKDFRNPLSILLWRLRIPGSRRTFRFSSTNFRTFLHCDGVKLKTAKIRIRKKNRFRWPCRGLLLRSQRIQTRCSPHHRKSQQVVGETPQYIQGCSMPSIALEKLIGKLGAPQTNRFGEFPRTHLRPLYKKLYANQYAAQLSPNEIRISHWGGWDFKLSSATRSARGN